MHRLTLIQPVRVSEQANCICLDGTVLRVSSSDSLEQWDSAFQGLAISATNSSTFRHARLSGVASLGDLSGTCKAWWNRSSCRRLCRTAEMFITAASIPGGVEQTSFGADYSLQLSLLQPGKALLADHKGTATPMSATAVLPPPAGNHAPRQHVGDEVLVRQRRPREWRRGVRCQPGCYSRALVSLAISTHHRVLHELLRQGESTMKLDSEC